MKSTRISAADTAIRTLAAAILLTLIAASGSGCGQRGPLYLPETEAAAQGQAGAGDAEAKPDSSGEDRTDESTDREDSE